MQDLITALQILAKYSNSEWPTGCEHDTLYVYVDPAVVAEEDIVKLETLGFNASPGDEHFYSFRFGSA